MNLRILTRSISLLLMLGCSEDDPGPALNVPDTYEFLRNGTSTVSYQGQTDRLNMLSEIKSYIVRGDQGLLVESQPLLDMYANENNPFSDAGLNASTKQLEDKTFPADVQWFKDLFASAATASADVVANNTQASQGTAGLIERGTSGNFVLVNEKGWEFTQLIEKGLMGAVFYHQIFNVYMSDDRVGNNVENDVLETGENYTPMEHHWDEAFGYWGVPRDFPQGDPVLTPEEDRFWAKYTIDRDELLDINQPLMEAYLTGRAAIVAKDYVLKNVSRNSIYDLHELITAATAVHYLNSAMDDLSSGDNGNLFHHLSEAYAFIKAISYSPRKAVSQTQIDTMLNTDLGVNADFWTVELSGLQTAKSTLVTAYPELDPVKDQL